MNKYNLVIFSQNVRKNKSLTDTILETQKNNVDIIFIQEPPRYLIKCIPSHTNPKGDPLFGTSNHPDWTTLINAPDPANPPVINCSFPLRHFHYSFPFNFFSCSIYSVGKSVTSHVMSHIIWLGVRDSRRTDH